MKTVLSILLLLVVVYIVGCTEDTTVNSPSSNTPVIASTNNAFAYTLAANSYSANSEYDLSFTSDSLAYSIIVSNYISGNGSLTVEMNASSSYMYVESLQSNKVVAFTQTNHGIPKKIKLIFNDFTGTINFALAKSNSN